MNEKYYITTPIFYPNGQPHIGHAYNAIATDVLARFHRADGREVFFLTGTDEHGLKMQQTAEKQGMTPLELANRNTAVFQRMMQVLNISHDDFIRTTEARHHKSCQAIWARMEAEGDIYLDRYAGWYSVRQEAYYDESDTELGEDGVRREREVGSPVTWNEEESYFFRLSKYQQPLLNYYEQHPDFIGPVERRNEIVSFVRSGLRDLSISRTTFNWGVEVPNNPAHVMYVWVDALTNYLTATGFPDEGAERASLWPANAHIIGKDIIRFHAIYWPAFLMSAGIALPKRVFAHGFLLNKGEKMSKSVGNVVDPFAMIEHYGLDPIRYFLLREVPFGQDGSISHQAIIGRINADLANDLGNLAQRSLSMIAKNCDACIPKAGEMTDVDEALLQRTVQALASARQAMKSQALHLALAAIFEVVAEANRYFAAQEPWSLRKSDPKRFASVLHFTLEVLRRLAILLHPFMPQSMDKLLDLLAVAPDKRQLCHIDNDCLEEGRALPAPQAIFPRYHEDDKHAH